jgi:ABC-2 type transport system ATP-binding protein
MTESLLALEVANLTKVYREGVRAKKVVSVEDLSFTVPQGVIFGFLGANGAGKTTTIKIALSLQAPTKGYIRILGSEAEDVTTRARVGYLPERPYFQMNLRANEYLNFHRSLFGKLQKSSGLMTNDELLRLVGLSDAKEKMLRSFSKGMLQRIGIAQSLLNDPELIILDEPMSGLDPVGRREVRNLILELNKRGKTVFFSSHILSDIESLCHQIVFLDRGKLKYSGNVEQLISSKNNPFEVIFRYPKGERPPFENIISTGDFYRAQLPDQSQAKVLVEKVWLSGGEIKYFGQIQRSLEDILFGEKK